MGKYDELVERLNARIEKQRSEHGNYFYNGVADPELAKAAAAITTLEAELAAMKARGGIGWRRNCARFTSMPANSMAIGAICRQSMTRRGTLRST